MCHLLRYSFQQEDNGYKVYWSNGAQINSPHDKGIAEQITKNSTPWWVVAGVVVGWGEREK
jgi:phosphomannomutase